MLKINKFKKLIGNASQEEKITQFLEISCKIPLTEMLHIDLTISWILKMFNFNTALKETNLIFSVFKMIVQIF